jgi:hypothetical protein
MEVLDGKWVLTEVFVRHPFPVINQSREIWNPPAPAGRDYASDGRKI